MTGSLFAKCGRWGIVVVQYGCVAHCVFEFITEFVVVSFICLLFTAVKRFISSITLIVRLIYYWLVNRSFNAHFVCYIFSNLFCVPLACRHRRLIAVER